MNLIRVVAFVSCGVGLAACGSGSGPDLNFDVFTPKPTTTVLSIESTPGAEARTSLGASCRTPCTLPIASGGDFTVSYALNGYEPQTLTVHSSLPSAGFPGLSSSAPTIDPNPVSAVLAQTAAPAKPKPPKRRRRPPPAPAAAAAPEAQPPQPPPSLGGFAPPPGTFTPIR